MPETTHVAIFLVAPKPTLERLRGALINADGVPSMQAFSPCPAVLSSLEQRLEAIRAERSDTDDGPARALDAFLPEFLFASPVGRSGYWLAEFPSPGCDPTDGAFQELYARMRERRFDTPEEAAADFTRLSGGVHNTADWRAEHWGTASDWRSPSLTLGWLASPRRPEADTALLLRAAVQDGHPLPYLRELSAAFRDVSIRCLSLTGDEASEHIFENGELTATDSVELGAEERAFLTREFPV